MTEVKKSIKKVLSSYNLLPKQIKASFWFVVANVMVRGISFITLPIFSRILTTEEYGIISVYQTWVSLISVIATLSLWGGVFKVAQVKFPESRNRVVSTFQGLATTITMMFFIISLILLPNFEKMLDMPKILIICMYIEILAQIPFYMWISSNQYDYQYKWIVVITIFNSIFSPIGSYIAVMNMENKAEAKIMGGLIAPVIEGIVLFVYNLFKGREYYNRELWKFGFSFSIVLVPHYLSQMLLGQSDRLMIRKLCGSSDAGIYSVAYNFAMLITLISNGIESSLTPHIYQSLKSKNEKNLSKQTTYVILVMAFATIGMICIIPEVFKWMLPKSYYGAMWAIPPVTAGAFFVFLYPLFGAIEFYFEENKYVTFASCAGAIINIILNYIFIKIFGFLAAAYTTLFCYILFAVCHCFFMKKVMKKNSIHIKIYDFKAILIISLVVVAFSIGIVPLYNHYIIRWLLIFAILMLIALKRKKIFEQLSNLGFGKKQ